MLEVLAILEGSRKRFHPLKKRGGAENVLPCLDGRGAQKVSDLLFSHLVAPLLVINNLVPNICLKPPLAVISAHSDTGVMWLGGCGCVIVDG